ncbi:transglutaminase family protein [Altericista sp. CCNU0014]|uniref:transglutaminase-like domain-containing protein n=1 Tax=Altericista sp. CCNU0014 TaxID=3082949 RepID=UPI00384C6DC2
MQIQIGYEIVFNSPIPIPMLLKLHVHPSVAGSILEPEQLQTFPPIPVREFCDSFGNRCVRIVAPEGELRLWNNAIVEVDGRPDPIDWNARQVPVSELPEETLQYLLSSRYCEVELLSQAAWTLFGNIAPGWPKVQAICDWVHSNIRYGYEHTHIGKTACGVYTERTGVCRDFAHLAIAFCRSLHIPARYAMGYLGDIGIPAQPIPMDFHAWFEVFLGGQWHTFDARHNTPRIGRILMARGRDATDAALTTSFGAAQLVGFKVWADEIPLAPVDPLSLERLSLDASSLISV